eukprot:CAMPEP_0117034668 /NCGR_PEP_ID=MMETSP0472-20121206/24667_1 /TAXON_ID=693140 ORGANISM="Tiarina fusus, Strain LIS" /NCGR_SAMPLE_ID=MMETSP0472 /ASSEMBLY_ACC=CAM_ASM_000603 /LENGTH=72 /DNA_ID=CAMNT_0004743905 /DNA_START=57 /DNA_END=275 /DNA_ORIENTATION=-
MNNQDYQYDKAGRLTAEDQMMMSNPNAMLKLNPTSEDLENVVRTTPQLSSTPTKCEFVENMKKIEMPKPFQL